MTQAHGEPALVLVSGGARGITARCVVALAERYGWGFVLLGRTSIDSPLPVWAGSGLDEAEAMRRLTRELAADPQRAGAPVRPIEIRHAYERLLARQEIDATLAAIRGAGGEAEYVALDVADPDLVERLRPVLARRGGVVSGIVHGAGAIADRRLDEKSASDFDTVFMPKVRGLRALLGVVDQSALRFVVLFSSAAGFYGNSGQADYALANEVLNKAAYALRRRLPAARILSVNWGPWGGGTGMVTPALQALFAERGVALIPPKAGADLLADALAPGADPPVQLVVGSPFTPWPAPVDRYPRLHRIVRRVSPADNAFLDDHMIGGKRVLPVTCAMAWIVDACEGRCPGLQVVRLDDCRVLGGVVFDEAEPRDLTLELADASRSDDRTEVRLLATVSGSGGGGRVQPLYRTQVVLAAAYARPRRDPGPPAPSPSRGDDDIGPYRDGTLFHGPCFQGIRSVTRLDDEGLEVSCRLPAVPADIQGQFRVGTLNPYVADALFQALLVWVRRICGTASLPVGTRTAELIGALDFACDYVVSVAVEERSDHRVVGDLTARSRSGDVLLRLVGAEVALSPTLAGLFEPARVA
jgi:NAD(P)-dependent dehydrogenase (short-subunit alcohol dehydrogenase family)